VLFISFSIDHLPAEDLSRMKHLVFIETNRAGVAAFEACKSRGIAATLIRSKPLHDLFIGADRPAAYEGLYGEIVLSDDLSNQSLKKALLQVQRKLPITAVLTTLEEATLITAQVAFELGLRATPLPAVAIARDKFACRELLRSKGVRQAESAEISNLDNAVEQAVRLKYPVVMKPRSGAGSFCAAVLQTEAELRAHYASAMSQMASLSSKMQSVVDRGFVLEEHVRGPLLSAEAGMKDDSYLPYMVSARKRAPYDEVLELGTMMPADISGMDTEVVHSYNEKVLRVLGLDLGIFHTELILSQEGPVLVEVNPRLMGASSPSLYEKATLSSIIDDLVGMFADETIRGPVKPMQYAASRALAARSAATVHTNLDWARLDLWKQKTVEARVRVQPGQSLPAMRDNFGVFGYFQVTSSTADDCKRLADELVLEAEVILGVPLAR
jgi:biotin carboxylase